MSDNDLSDEVKSVELYTSVPVIYHGYVGPFLFLYGLIFSLWIFYFGLMDYFELGCICLAATGVIQVLTCLSCHWSIHVKAKLSCKRVKDISSATLVKVVPTPNNGHPQLVSLLHETGDSGEPVISFIFQKITYFYDSEEKKRFYPVSFPTSEQLSFYQNSKGYQEEDEVKVAVRKYGENLIDMTVPEFMDLFKERATAPFFVFQVFCVGLWCLDEYWYYSLFTLAMLVMFECTLVHQQMRNMKEIRNMSSKPFQIQVYRYRKWRPIPSNELLPGDICSIGHSQSDVMVPCDLLLLRGSCIVDESMLTGESIPQMKEPIESLPGNDILDMEAHRKLHLLSGGTKVVNHTPPPKTSAGLKSPDNGCVAYVLKTGFSTSQGKLLKTILYGVKRVTANNLETFMFIVFLLIFAIAASAYVWINGTKDPKRNRYKLFLECTLILTSVVPPELPIELSLAVNSSLMALSKLGVFCTEPFRIPFAGKVDVCCFDKTGTLTSDNLVVEGVAGVDGNRGIQPVKDLPLNTVRVLGCCHSLTYVDDKLLGDPMEQAAIKAIDWTVSKGDVCMAKKGMRQSVKLLHRHHFTSALRRMSVIASIHSADSTTTNYIAAVKGAPETLRKMFTEIPDFYDELHKTLSCNGGRVMALGHKHLGTELSPREIREMLRDEVESELVFDGFLVLSCPLKEDSKNVISEIKAASHYTVMITGDNPLTACHVASDLSMNDKPLLVLSKVDPVITVEDEVLEDSWNWMTADEAEIIPFDEDCSNLIGKYHFCLTGDAISYLQTLPGIKAHMKELLIHSRVFARVSPKQKEWIIHEFKELGFTALMCGDGTNDVGALKHSHVGVALLPGTAEKMEPLKDKRKKKLKDAASPEEAETSKRQKPPPTSSKNMSRAAKMRGIQRGDLAENTNKSALEQQQAKLKEMLDEMEKEQNQVVKLGDASIASPFTSRYCTPASILHVIKQGRCTLVTTLQMFKILALNALILAYCQSVLYLDGIKFSDGQATLQGVLLAGCFLFISRSRPLTTLSKERPLPNIFNLYTILTVLTQFAIHFTALVTLVKEAKRLTPAKDEESVDLEKKFEANLLNSTVYIISISLQVATFFVNYRGNPFMESIVQNKALFYSVIFSLGGATTLLMGWLPELSQQFEIVEFPEEFKLMFCQVIIADFFGAWLVDRFLRFTLGYARLKN